MVSFKLDLIRIVEIEETAQLKELHVTNPENVDMFAHRALLDLYQKLIWRAYLNQLS